MKQINEIGVKALSPGINDPGTAVKCTDLLFILLGDKMQIPDREFELGSNGEPRVIFRELSLHELLFLNIAPLRKYGKADPVVMNNIMEGFKNLIYADRHERKHTVILLKHIRAMVIDMASAFKTDLERERVNEMIDRINELLKNRSINPI